MLDRVDDHHAWVTEVVLGTVRQFRALSWMLDRVMRRRAEAGIRAVLLASLYELFHMRDVAPYAVVNDAVESVKHDHPAAAGFVNAVLRRTIARRDELERELAAASPGVRLSHPDALVRRWTSRWGEERALRLCHWNNERAESILRIQRSRVEPDLFRARLRDAGLEVVAHPSRPDECLILPRGVRVPDVPGFAEGWFTVQDPSTLAAIDLLDPKPGEKILDACAAPGGKALAIADRMSDRGTVVAADAHDDRLVSLRENIARGHFESIRAARADATNAGALRKLAAEYAGGSFDAVLLDVPCSNTGVIRRRPDARWRFSDTRLKHLVATQQRMLSAAATLVGVCGRLVYSTCSLEQEEDEGLVKSWLEANPEFRLAREIQLVPPDSKCDGAYAVLLVRR